MTPSASSQPDELLASMPHARHLGVRLVTAAPDAVEGTLDWAPERCTTGGVLHGGVLLTLADSLGGLCAFLNLPDGALTSTIESKTNFLRPVRSGTVTGRTVPV